eukprot:3804083-Lingulodinium_polyedra.AAC.1
MLATGPLLADRPDHRRLLPGPQRRATGARSVGPKIHDLLNHFAPWDSYEPPGPDTFGLDFAGHHHPTR